MMLVSSVHDVEYEAINQLAKDEIRIRMKHYCMRDGEDQVNVPIVKCRWSFARTKQILTHTQSHSTYELKIR